MIKLARRTLLRAMGVTGLAIALPPLEAMFNSRGLLHGKANAAGTPAQKRLVLIHVPQGVYQHADDSPTPAEAFFYPVTGSPSGTPLAITPGIAPLTDLASDINLITGMSYGPIYKHIGSHGHAVSCFTGFQGITQNDNDPSGSGGPSVDQIAASVLNPNGTSLSAMLYDNDESWWSWKKTGATVARAPMINEPAQLFKTIFPYAGQMGSAADDAKRRDKSMLDFVASDITRLQKVLGAADRQRLDEHLASIRSLETSLGAVSLSPSCNQTSVPTYANYSKDANDDRRDEYSKLMMDLLHLALQCDVSRVVFFSMGPSQNYREFSNLKLDHKVDYHRICHGVPQGSPDPLGGIPNADQICTDYYKQITVWHMQQLAYFLGKIKGTIEGAGSMLDSCAVVATSEFSSGTDHGENNLFAIVAGKIGNMATGRSIAVPCKPDQRGEIARCVNKAGGETCVNDLWQAALQAVGALSDAQKFGDPSVSTKALSGLWV
jgi:hypothetical protein